MKARKLIMTITAALLLAAPTAVLAQQGGPGQGGGFGGGWGGGPGWNGGGQGGGHLRMLPRMLRHLDLEPGQEEQIEDILENARTAIEPLVDQSIEAREAFHQDHGIGSFDEPTYRQFFESLSAIDVEMRLISAEAVSQAWKILDTEQQEELLEMLERFGRGMKRHGGGRRSP